MDDFESAVREIYYWQYSYTGSFYNRLLDLFSHADRENIKRLHLAFPMLGLARIAWENADNNGDDLFRQYGLLKERG